MRIEELIDLYGNGILRLCILYLGDRQLAEDAFPFLAGRMFCPAFYFSTRGTILSPFRAV